MLRNKNKPINQQKITNQLTTNIATLQATFKEDSDFTIRHFRLAGQFPGALIYLNSIVDNDVINQDILRPIMRKSNQQPIDKINEKNVKKIIFEETIYQSEGSEEDNFVKIIENILRGQTVVLIDTIKRAFLLDTFKISERSISEPETERVIRGPKDCFIESLSTNISLLRYRLPFPDLRIKSFEIGSMTKSRVALCYIEGLATDALIQEVEDRLNGISIDRILDASYIEEQIQDNPRSPFPQIKLTERPDAAVGNLVEGRAAIIVDGSPFVLIAPATLMQFMQSPADYNEKYLLSSFTRLLRVFSLILSLTIPSLYVAAISFHPELIPTRFAVAITSGRTGVPFPLIIEIFIMEIAMEILREATVRMPKQVGGTIGIVGVLVIGQAAVEAGFVSPLTIVIVALTTIASYAVPSYSLATSIRMLRFPMLIMTGFLGFYGFIISWIIISNHLLSLQSFGIPYMNPLAPANWGDMKDSIIRAPLRWLKGRPDSLQPPNKRRVK